MMQDNACQDNVWARPWESAAAMAFRLEMSFLEFLVTRDAPQASLNYPPLPMNTGSFSLILTTTREAKFSQKPLMPYMDIK